MTRPPMARRRPQARRLRRFETERPTVRAIIREGSTWASVNVQRLPGLVLVVCCLAVAVYLFGDLRFFVYQSQVTGNQAVPGEQIYQASGVDMLSVFFVDPRLVRQALLERLPSLQDARVALDLPARLSIHVTERKAQFVWEVDGQSYVADDRGTILGGAAIPPGAIVIRCRDGCAAPAGPALDAAMLDTVSRLSRLLAGERFFEYSNRLGVSWRTPEGWPVYFGVGGDLAEKIAVMRSVSADLAASGVQPQFLDVGVPSRPYYR